MKKLAAALCAATFLFFVLLVPPSAAARHSPPCRPLSSPPPVLDPSLPALALTFDDGPHPVYTDIILDCLEQNSARGTFFIIGEKINSCLPQINRILTGHQLGNHTWGHVDLTCQTPYGIERQISSVYDSVNALFSVGPELVRPPYGFSNSTIRQNVPFPLIHWSVDTLDWYSKDASAVSEHILTHAKDGDIILMHDIYSSTAEAVEAVVPKLRERGFQLVTVSELFALKGKSLEAGTVYFKAE